MADFQRKTFTCHPIQRYRMPHGRFTFNKGILVIDSQNELDAFTKSLESMKPREQRRIYEVTADNIAQLLAGQNQQFPEASQGTDSDTAKMAERALAGDVAKAQIASRPAAPASEPVTEKDLAPVAQPVAAQTPEQPKAAGLVLPK